MKRLDSGMDAFSKIALAPVPERTETYTPISHSSIITQIRKEIGYAGFYITAEDYRCTQNADIAVGNYRIKYKEDDDIELTANFINSYNKQYAFRFALGSMVKICMNGMFINDNSFGTYRKIHKGDADILSERTISKFILGADAYWDSLIDFKENLKKISLKKHDILNLLGELFFEKEALNTYQMNMIRKEMKNPTYFYGTDPDNAWTVYNNVTQALKEAHPSEWLDRHHELTEVFVEQLGIDLIEVPPLELDLTLSLDC